MSAQKISLIKNKNVMSDGFAVGRKGRFEMIHKKKTVFFVCAFLAVLFCLSGCGKQEKLRKVKVGEVTHSVFYAPQYVAISQGFFEEEGLEPELSNLQGTDKVMSGILSDQIEIGLSGPEAAIYVYTEGKEDYVEVFAQLTKRDGSFLVGKEADADFRWEKLRGKTVIPGRKGGVPYMTLEYVIRQHGLNPFADMVFDDSIQFSLMAGAFAGGNADYVSLFEPTASMIEEEGKGAILCSIGQESGEIPYTAYNAKKSFIEKNSELIQKFTNAVCRGQKWVLEHTAQEVADAVQYAFPDTDRELLTKVVERYQSIDVWNSDPVLREESFERLQTVMSSAGELKTKAPYSVVVNNSFAEKAVEQMKP